MVAKRERESRQREKKGNGRSDRASYKKKRTASGEGLTDAGLHVQAEGIEVRGKEGTAMER